MMARREVQPGKGVLELIEEVFHLLRKAPFRVLAAYYIGSLPFVLSLLYFWGDMSKSAFAYARLAQSAFVVTILFVWMKTWHSVAAGRLWTEVSGQVPPRWSPACIFRVMARQTFVQASGLLVLPIALLITPAFGPAYALYQNVTVLDRGEKETVRALLGRASKLARLWPKQNFLLIWVLSPYLLITTVALFVAIIPIASAVTRDWTTGFLSVFAFFLALLLTPLSPFGMAVALNVGAMLLSLPGIAQVLLGIETSASQNPSSMLNSTFFAAVCGIVYLCLDPLVKTAYVLRCFYGESLRTGEDLRVEFRRLAQRAASMLLMGVVAVGAATHGMAMAASEEAPAGLEDNRLSVSAPELAVSLRNEIGKREYAWRMPREIEQPQEGLIGSLIRGVFETVADWVRKLFDVVRKVLRWLRDLFPESWITGQGGRHLETVLKLLLWVFALGLACAVAVFAWRAWKQRRARSAEVVAEAVEAAPDLSDEGTAADQLSKDGWVALADELMEKGELRLALRAMFLATLAALAERELVRIARFKSNQDYGEELRRRAHAEPGILRVFGESVSAFEIVWYGAHEPTREMLRQVIANQERVRAYA